MIIRSVTKNTFNDRFESMIDAAHQTWLDAIWQTTVNAASEGYYEDSIKLFSMIVMSRNWWAPEARPAVCNK